MKALMLWILVGGLCLGVALNASADPVLLTRAAGPATLLPTDEEESGVARAAFTFDLPSVEEDELLFLDATMEWTAPFVEAGGAYEFIAYAITEPWNAASVAVGTADVVVDPKPIGYWAIEGPDFDRHGGLVLFRMTKAVRAWLKGQPNYGILIKVSGIDEELSSEDFSGMTVKVAVNRWSSLPLHDGGSSPQGKTWGDDS